MGRSKLNIVQLRDKLNELIDKGFSDSTVCERRECYGPRPEEDDYTDYRYLENLEFDKVNEDLCLVFDKEFDLDEWY